MAIECASGQSGNVSVVGSIMDSHSLHGSFLEQEIGERDHAPKLS